MRLISMRPGRALAALVLPASLLIAATAPAAHAATTYKLTLSASGLDQPVYIANPPGENKRYFIVEKPGKILVLKNGSVLSTPYLDMTSLVSSDGEGGLLSLAFDPMYSTNRKVYVYYVDTSHNITIALYLTSASNPDRADASSRTTLVSIPHPTYTNHYGGMMEFDPIAAQSGKAMLYFGTGDGGGTGDPNDNAQNKSSGLGKLFRIDVNAANPTKEMYAYGLRNPMEVVVRQAERRPADRRRRAGLVGRARLHQVRDIARTQLRMA